ncbi:hypothetical protein [Aeoliella sp. SH292]|uniref:hypothetical protein n=1 Tax=Aeoliella sp. SH292 TaxID=3454464 RepID=UPI003F96758A
MRFLRVTASIFMLIATGTVGAATIFLDDFGTDTSANYTRRVVLGRSGSVLPTLTVAAGELQVSSVGSGGVATQTLSLHNTATLGVGLTLLVDVDIRGATYGSNSSEMLGLVVSAGLMNGLSLPSSATSNQDLRDDEYSFLFGGFRNSGGRDVFRTDGYTAVGGGTITEQNVDQMLTTSSTSTELDKIASLFIHRSAASTYQLGWVDNLDVPHLVRTVSMDLGASPMIGLFTDTRNAAFSISVDNLRIIPEPSSALLACLGGVGLLGWCHVRKK